MRCGENPVHERMNSIAENKGAVKTICRGRDASGMSRKNDELRLISPFYLVADFLGSTHPLLTLL